MLIINFATAFLLCSVLAKAQNENDSIHFKSNELQQLPEVVVKSNKPKVKLSADGMKMTIAGSDLAKIGTADEVLRRLPTLNKTENGIEVRGRGVAEIYVNGRRVYDVSELEKIASDQLLNVEIINNPGAQYAAETKAVVKIKMRRPQGEGFGFREHFFLNEYGYGLGGGNQFDMNYRNKGFDLSASITGDGVQNGQTFNQRSDIYLENQLLQQTTEGMTEEYTRQNLSAKLQMNYIVNEHHSFGARYEFNRMPKLDNDVNRPVLLTLDGERLQDVSNIMELNRRTYAHIANAYYSGEMGKWKLDVNIDGLWNDSKESHSNYETIIDYSMSAATREMVLSNSYSTSCLYAIKAVASCPLFGGELSFGTEYNDTHRTDSNVNPKATDGDTRTREHIWAGFVEYGYQLKKWNFKAGLRYENVSARYYDSGILEQTKNYGDWFPSVGVSTQIGKVQLGANYSMDIRRPNFKELTDNLLYINSLLYQSGNPYLKPVYTNSFAINASWQWLMLSAGMNHVKDDITYGIMGYSEADPRISIYQTSNISDYNGYYVNLFAQPSLFSVWRPTWGIVMQKSDYKQIAADGEEKNMNRPIFVFVWNNSIQLPAKFRLNIDALAQTRGDNLNMHFHKAWFTLSAKIQRSFFKDKLDVGFGANDIFESYRQVITAHSVRDLYSEMRNNGSLYLTLTYKINVAKDKYKGSGAGEKQKQRL